MSEWVPEWARRALACAALLSAWTATTAIAQDRYPFTVESVKEGSTHRVIARNGGRAPIQLTFSLASSTNLRSSRAWPFVVVLHAGQTDEMVRVRPADERQGYNFSYRYAVLLGNPQARPDPNARYRIPFANGLGFRVSQAPGGPLITHNDVQTANAIDIVMPEGTPIVAARAGYVIEMLEKLDTRADLAGRGNLIRIFHDDATWADYAHLSRLASDLALNARIDAGTLIGYSGNTGQSSGPHLHFHVQHNDSGTVRSIPLRFHTRTQGVVTPVYQATLRADY